MIDLSGTWYVVPTSFADDGTLDLDSQRNLVDAAVEWGVDGLTVLGVMSEATSLSDVERSQSLAAIVEASAGRVPVAVGCSAASAHLVRSRILEATAAGAAAAMVSAPALLRNVDALPAFYAAASAGVEIPIVVQDEPAATGVLVPVSGLRRCLEAAHSVTVKLEDPPTPPKISALLAADPSLHVFGGLGGVSAFSELSRGACGTMTGFAFPEILRAVRLALAAGDRNSAGRIFDKYLPLIQFEAQPGIGLLVRKEVLRRRGAIATATSRGTAGRPDATLAAELTEILERIELAPSRQPLVVAA
jgi:4-hydroxy-tetrahydrodipicolinate synthase